MYACGSKKTKGYGARSFLYASATLWNDLCDDRLTEADSVAVFKGRLKTHLCISSSSISVLMWRVKCLAFYSDR